MTGTIARLYLIRRLGEAFERPIDEVLDFIARYRVAAAGGVDHVLRRDDGARAPPEQARTSTRSSDAIDEEAADDG